MAQKTKNVAGTGRQDVDGYLAALPEEQRGTLEELRGVIRALVPDATEGISYGVPAFKLHGRPLVSLGPAKDHCGFYVQSPAVVEAHADELKGYDTAKGTVRLPYGKPLPAALIAKLVQARIDENQAMAKGR